MTPMTDADYERLKMFMSLYYEWFIAGPSHRPESHPVAVLERLEKKSRSQAKRGLEMAINDCIEDSSEWSPEVVALADKRFLLENAPRLSEIRATYSRMYLKVLKRGSIKSLNEYYLVKGILDGGGVEPGAGEAEKLVAMLTEYENRLPPASEK